MSSLGLGFLIISLGVFILTPLIIMLDNLKRIDMKSPELAPATDSRILKARIDKLETELRRNKGSACRLDFGAIIPLEGEVNEITIESGKISELKACLPYLDKDRSLSERESCRLKYGDILIDELNDTALIKGTKRTVNMSELKSCAPYLDKVESKQIEGKE